MPFIKGGGGAGGLYKKVYSNRNRTSLADSGVVDSIGGKG